MLNDNPQLLRPGAISHALHQQPVNTRLRPGHFDAIDNRVRGLLYLGSRAQIKHNPLNFRLVRNIRRAQLQSDGVANLLGNMYSLGAISGNPRRQGMNTVSMQNGAHFMGIQRRCAFIHCPLQQVVRFGRVSG